MMRVSKESNWSVWPGRGIREKVNLPIFKDEKTKDVVTYHSWQWDIAIFCPSGWDDRHLMPYVFQSLQGFLGDQARSLGEDATLNDIFQTLDKHYGIVMTFNILGKELYSLRQGSGGECGKIWGAPVTAGPDTPVRVSGKDPTRAHRGNEVRSPLQWSEPQISINVGP